jgi:hypothetical protein
MVRSYTQLDIFGAQTKRKIFKRDWNGRFEKENPEQTLLEKLKLENFQLKNKNEELERKNLALVKYQRILLTK